MCGEPFFVPKMAKKGKLYGNYRIVCRIVPRFDRRVFTAGSCPVSSGVFVPLEGEWTILVGVSVMCDYGVLFFLSSGVGIGPRLNRFEASIR